MRRTPASSSGSAIKRKRESERRGRRGLHRRKGAPAAEVLWSDATSFMKALGADSLGEGGEKDQFAGIPTTRSSAVTGWDGSVIIYRNVLWTVIIQPISRAGIPDGKTWIKR